MKTDHIPNLIPLLNNTNLWTYNPRFNCKDETDIKSYLDKSLHQKEKQERFPLLIYKKANNQLAGTTSFYNISNTNRTICIGYTIISPPFQRTGINQECKQGMLDWCFGQMEFERVEFRVDKNNEKSVLALKRLGAVEEGVLRSEILTVSGRRRDTVILSILKNEWKSRKM